MPRLLNIGFGNSVNTGKITSVVSPEAAPVKRLIQVAKEEGRVIDATLGRRTKAVIVMDDGHVVLSALQPETIARRFSSGNDFEGKEEEDEQ